MIRPEEVHQAKTVKMCRVAKVKLIRIPSYLSLTPKVDEVTQNTMLSSRSEHSSKSVSRE